MGGGDRRDQEHADPGEEDVRERTVAEKTRQRCLGCGLYSNECDSEWCYANYHWHGHAFVDVDEKGQVIVGKGTRAS